MTVHELDSLLMRIRDDKATPEEVARARSLVEQDERLPEELREVALVEDVREDAVALLAVLGHDDGFGELVGQALLSEAILLTEEVPSEHHEAQVVDLAEAMEEELAQPFPWPLTLAIQSYAGHVDIARSVLKSLDLSVDLGLVASLRAEAGQVDCANQVFDAVGDRTERPPIALALAAEAGEIELTEAVFKSLDLPWKPLLVRDAVLGEAGEISLGDQVHEHIVSSHSVPAASLGEALRAAAGDVGNIWAKVAADIGAPSDALPVAESVVLEAGEIDVVQPVMSILERDSLGVHHVLPPPANRPRWGLAAIVSIAAAALLMLGVRATVGDLPLEVTAAPLQFAAAGEVVVHELEYSENVQVFQVEGDEGAMILWVDEEAVL